MSKAVTIPNYINHIVFVIDESGSMDNLREATVQVFDQRIAHLAKRSQENEQETRVSVYLFNTKARCIIYDKDVLRLPSLRSYYQPDGGTALRDATELALNDLAKTPELYGEHAFLLYAITDGEENSSRNISPAALKKKIAGLPAHWTLAALVPSASSVHDAKAAGFPAENIEVWSATKAGIEELGRKMDVVHDNFMRGRTTGIRSVRGLFKLDVQNVTTKNVKQQLDALKRGTFNVYKVKPSHHGTQIRDFVETLSGEKYRQGSAFYQLSKSEIIQATKVVALKENSSGRVFSGPAARSLLGLPDHEVRVEPAEHSQYTLFVQSTSVNRKLVKDTEVLVVD